MEQLGEALAKKAQERQVTSLYLGFNSLRQLPVRALCSLDSLTALFVTSNELSELPDLSPLRSLAWLDASDNLIGEISASLCSMSQLRQLDFTNNRLTAVPSALSRLTNLHMLSLAGNDALPLRLASVSPTGGLEGCQAFMHEVCSHFARVEHCRDAMYETLLCFQRQRQNGTAAWDAVPLEVVQFFILPFVWASRHDEVWDFAENDENECDEELVCVAEGNRLWGST